MSEKYCGLEIELSISGEAKTAFETLCKLSDFFKENQIEFSKVTVINSEY